MTDLDTDHTAADERQRPNRVLRVLFLIGFAAFAAFWTWALFFASKEAVNKIDDEEWAQAAEKICASANADRLELADFTVLEDGNEDLIQGRADIIEEATDILASMIDDLEALPIDSEKGVNIVPLWVDDYRIYLDDRYRYVDELRTTGENLPFYESPTDEGLPITEKLETFAGDNEIPSCAPPRDLSR